jgi:hypothetical protein
MKTKSYNQTTVVPLSQPARESWMAWINKMPPPPDALHVRGQVTVPNPGVDIFLYRKEPQGINPTILLLDLVLVQQPGIWPQIVVTKPAAYEEVGRDLAFVTVEIHAQGSPVVSVPVEIVH